MNRRKNSKATEEELNHTFEMLHAFSDGIDEIIYVADPYTHEILFANKKTKELLGEKIVDKKCYILFQKNNKPCPFCPSKHIFGKNLGKTYTEDFQNQKNKRWYRCIANAVQQPGGKYVLFEIAADITEQKKMEEALRESEELFRSIVENSHNIVLILDDNFRIVYANDEIVRLSGHPKEEIVRQDFRKLLDEESRSLMEDRYLRRQRGENVPPQYEFKIMRKDGEKRDIEIKSTTIRDREGRTRTIAQLLDITERKKMENERKRFEERLSALNIYGQSLSRVKSRGEIYKLTLDAMEKTLGFEFSDFFILEGKKLCLIAHRGYSRTLSLKLPLDGDKGVTVRVARTGKPVFVPDVSKDKAYILGGEGSRSELAVPIKIGKKVLGVLNVESKRLAAFDENHRQLLEILASHAATATTNLKRQERLSALIEYGRNLNMAKSIGEIYKLTLDAMEKTLGFEYASLFMVEGKNLRIVAHRGHPRKVRPILPLNGDKGVTVKAARAGKPVLIPDLRKEKAYVAGRPGMLSELAVPTKMGNEILGVLNVESERLAAFNEEDRKLLEILASHASTAISNLEKQESLREARRQLEVYAGKLEQKVEERTRELRKSQEELLKAQRLAVIGEMAGMVGHDLRNPLTSIAGAEYYLKKRLGSEANDKIKEMLELIEKNIAHSNKIISDLLDYSRQVELELTESNPKSILKEALSIVTIPKNVKVTDLTENKPKVKVDVEKITRVFINIVKNATEAMPRGGTLTIKSRKLNSNCEIVFSDTGVGMSKETLQEVWTPLFTTKARGMGFGLPICKRFVEAHGGSISVESTRGKGTTFKVTFPIEPKIEEGGEKVWVKPLESSLLTTTRT